MIFRCLGNVRTFQHDWTFCALGHIFFSCTFFLNFCLDTPNTAVCVLLKIQSSHFDFRALTVKGLNPPPHSSSRVPLSGLSQMHLDWSRNKVLRSLGTPWSSGPSVAKRRAQRGPKCQDQLLEAETEAMQNAPNFSQANVYAQR